MEIVTNETKVLRKRLEELTGEKQDVVVLVCDEENPVQDTMFFISSTFKEPTAASFLMMSALEQVNEQLIKPEGETLQ